MHTKLMDECRRGRVFPTEAGEERGGAPGLGVRVLGRIGSCCWVRVARLLGAGAFHSFNMSAVILFSLFIGSTHSVTKQSVLVGSGCG